jgi:hypothetical protein
LLLTPLLTCCLHLWCVADTFADTFITAETVADKFADTIADTFADILTTIVADTVDVIVADKLSDMLKTLQVCC